MQYEQYLNPEGFLLPDKTFIHERKFYVEGSKNLVVFVHGLDQHLQNYFHIKDFFVSKGVSFYMFDQRGMGLSQGKNRNIVESYDAWISDLVYILKNRIETKDCKKMTTSIENIFIVGHSNGTSLSCLTGIREDYSKIDKRIKGVILAASAFHIEGISPIKLALSGFLRAMTPKMIISPGFTPEQMTNNPKWQKHLKENEKIMVQMAQSCMWATTFLKAQSEILDNFGKMKTPILFLHGDVDKITSLQSTTLGYEKCGSIIKDKIIYKNKEHELFWDEEVEKINQDIFDWMNKVVESKENGEDKKESMIEEENKEEEKKEEIEEEKKEEKKEQKEQEKIEPSANIEENPDTTI